MSLATLYSRASLGIDAPVVIIEVHLGNGLPGMTIVGLAETAVRESKDRVRTAIINSHFEFPQKRITINLAPADLPKEGTRFDLAIALGILAASRQIPDKEMEQYEFIGELALSGLLRPIKSILPIAIHASASQHTLILPLENAHEASLSQQTRIHAAGHLLDVTAHLNHSQRLPDYQGNILINTPKYPDLAHVRGHHAAKRALEIAAAGGHSMLMQGPPGTGKTLLANCLPGILPPLSDNEALESASIISLSHTPFKHENWKQRPFRSPHHTASSIAIAGGGSHPRPGEVSLAHHGILFLDELPEFSRKTLEVLREPIESGAITISRAAQQVRFPARFQLIAAMNPCPCGYLGDPDKDCNCSSEQVQRYRHKISGPLLDRIDLQIHLPRIHFSQLEEHHETPSSEILQRVIQARDLQQARGQCINAQLSHQHLDSYCSLSTKNRQFLQQMLEQFHLSTRSHHRILKVARTIADLQQEPQIQQHHLAEAVQYRCL
ncbi:MAG: YifB family Mg chelatase-like AAA ATPase [Gammaproteobacteria bacterium]|nr:YifB family Mg chelatase-like AAA ATPase [Gammaproteobacteria bacterium]